MTRTRTKSKTVARCPKCDGPLRAIARFGEVECGRCGEGLDRAELLAGAEEVLRKAHQAAQALRDLAAWQATKQAEFAAYHQAQKN